MNEREALPPTWEARAKALDGSFNDAAKAYRTAARELRAALSQPSPAVPALHPDTADLVKRFSAALAEKLELAERKYGHSNGWKSPEWMDECRQKLLEHVAKGDPRDVAAYCAFLWHHGASTVRHAGLCLSAGGGTYDDECVCGAQAKIAAIAAPHPTEPAQPAAPSCCGQTPCARPGVGPCDKPARPAAQDADVVAIGELLFGREEPTHKPNDWPAQPAYGLATQEQPAKQASLKPSADNIKGMVRDFGRLCVQYGKTGATPEASDAGYGAEIAIGKAIDALGTPTTTEHPATQAGAGEIDPAHVDNAPFGFTLSEKSAWSVGYEEGRNATTEQPGDAALIGFIRQVDLPVNKLHGALIFPTSDGSSWDIPVYTAARTQGKKGGE